MRNRINRNLIYTTSESETKRNFCQKNRSSHKRRIFMMQVFGKRKEISHDEYVELEKIGFNVSYMDIDD